MENLAPSTSEKKVAKSLSIWSELDSEVETIVIPTGNSRAASIVEIDKYCEMPLLPRNADPLLWWKENKILFPTLFEISKRRLCIPATSVPCERIFSKEGQIITDRRSRLTSSVKFYTLCVLINSFFLFLYTKRKYCIFFPVNYFISFYSLNNTPITSYYIFINRF